MNEKKQLLSQVGLVLVRPKYPENIGAVARIAYNMGLSRIIVIRDSLPEREPMAKMATHKAAHLIDSLELYPTLAEGLEEFSVIIGTTARHGKKRNADHSPRKVIEKILPELVQNKIALVFGPEDTGLTNEELNFCTYLSAIPTADFSSLNLAQAIGIHCYELYYQLLYGTTSSTYTPKLATSFELEGMYSHLEDTLLHVDFLKEKSHTYWMSSIRNFFNRTRLTAKDAKIIRGICRQFLWYQKEGRKKE